MVHFYSGGALGKERRELHVYVCLSLAPYHHMNLTYFLCTFLQVVHDSCVICSWSLAYWHHRAGLPCMALFILIESRKLLPASHFLFLFHR